jgi:hypothetical protein
VKGKPACRTDCLTYGIYNETKHWEVNEKCASSRPTQ